MDETTNKALDDLRMHNEGFALQRTIQLLEYRYGFQQVINKNGISGPELASVDCLSGRASCYDKTHAAICLIRPKDVFWKNLEFAGVYDCGGDFFVNYSSGTKKAFKKALPVPETAMKLTAQNLVKLSDGPSSAHNRMRHQEAAMAYLMAFASYLELDYTNENHSRFIGRFDQLLARLK